MKVDKISFGSVNLKTPEKEKRHHDYLGMFYSEVKNSADMTDTILVPRTIFKGYLGIMVGTTFVTLGSLIKKGKFSKALSITGLLASLYGTYSFVRPYILKGKGVETAENKSEENS